ncbi:putative ankyrin repeat protein [Rhypophila decipiens]
MAPSVSLSALPAELVVFVADNLDSPKDLSAFALVGRKFYSIVNAILYKRARGDAWPLAWAAHCGVAATLRKALAAGADPNHQFAGDMSFQKWKKKSAATKLALHENDSEVWDTDNECDTDMEGDWSPETEDTDHAATVTTNHPSSNSTSDTWGHNAFDDSDGDVSDVSMDDHPYNLHLADDDSSTLDELEDEEDMYEVYGIAVRRRFNPIHLAARGGHNDIIEILLDHGANLNVPCKSLCDCSRLYGLLNSVECPERDAQPPSWSALHIALCHSQSETAKLLLSRGASYMMELDADTSINCTSTALHQAAAMGLVDVVRYILDQGIQTDVDVRDDKTLTPFYHAYARRRWDSTVPLLLERGADINVDINMFIPYTTITPLGEACRLGNFEVVDKLLDLGADPNHGFIATNTGGGLSPLHMCCMLSAKHPEWGAKRRFFEEEEMGTRRMRTIEKLVAHGALIEAKDCSGDTPLMLATQNRNLPAVRAVIKAGADIHQRNGLGRTAVMQAILGPSQYPRSDTPGLYITPVASILRELFRSGARLDERDADGNSVLHIVFQARKTDLREQTEILRILLNRPEARSLLNVKNLNSYTPLREAFMSANLEACEILVRRGCLRDEPEFDWDELVTMFGYTHSFDDNDQEKVAEFILDLDTAGVATSDSRLFSGLLAGSHTVGARAVWRRGLPPIPPSELRLLLYLALRVMDFDLAFSLLEAGADVHVDSGDYRNPLGALIERHGRSDSSMFHQFLEALLDRGASIHHTAGIGSSQRILNKVITKGMSECLEIMLKKQPLLNDPGAIGGCYLHDAVAIPSVQRPANERMIDMLLSSGASISEVNNDGETPLSVLLKSLCKHRSFTWRYHRYIKKLFGPDVDINRRNAEGRSIADYLEMLMQKNSQPKQTTFLTRRIQLIDCGNGMKSLKFLPRPPQRVKPANQMGSMA